MCARFAFFSMNIQRDVFGIDPIPDFTPHWNIAPTDFVAAISVDKGKRVWRFYQWGLVPGWAKDMSIGQKLINARCETVAEKPSFRSAIKRRRCVIPADGFYEWKGPKGSKQPYFIRKRSKQPLALAGMWEYWEGNEGVVESCTILTSEPNAMMAEVHNRMPVILGKSQIDSWLNPRIQDFNSLRAVCEPYPSDLMEMYPVVKAMSNPRFDSPEAVEPIPPTTLF